MAYTPVPTVSMGDLWTAADHNTYIRDNFAAGVPDIFTTKGDLAVASGADAAVRLPVGADGQALYSDGSASAGLAWKDIDVVDLLQAKGDLIVGVGVNQVDRLAAGTDGQFLMVSSSASAGLEWADDPLVGLMTTKGDMIVADGSGPVRFPSATADGYYLVTSTTASTGMEWARSAPASSAARYITNATQTLGTGKKAIDYQLKIWDADTAVTTGASWHFTVQAGKGGFYLVVAQCMINASSVYTDSKKAVLNIVHTAGSATEYIVAETTQVPPSTSVTQFLRGSVVLNVAAGDTIHAMLNNLTGGSLTLNADGAYCSIVLFRIF